MNLEKWIKRCDSLSKRTFIEEDGVKKYLFARLSGTSQANDIKKSAVVIDDFYRTKDNLKCKSGNPSELYKSATSDTGFDMPLWAYKSLNLPLQVCNMTFMPQTKTCNVYCPWCFVDDYNKNGRKEEGAYFSNKEVIDAFLDARKGLAKEMHVMRLSGGEPLLVPWQWLENLEELKRRGLSDDVYFQGETNLTTGSFIRQLQREGRLDKNFWEKIAEYNNFGVLCSFKGTDWKSNLRAIGFSQKDGTVNPEYKFLDKERWNTFETMVKAGIDVYPLIYDPNPKTLKYFLEKGVKKFGEEFALKTWIIPLKIYEPIRNRLDSRGIQLENFQKGLDENFKKSRGIMEKLIPKITGCGYKSIPRNEIILKVQ